MKNKPGPLFRDKFFGAPYKSEGQSKEEGFDCLSLVGNYYRELGNEFPDISDLYHMYRDEPEVRKEFFRRVWERIFKVTKEVPLGYIQAGDLLAFEARDFGDYPGIYLGNGVVGVTFLDKGVTVVRYDDLSVLQARRGI